MSDALPPLAPELQVSRWYNTAQPITLRSLRGRVVLLHAFQMLCPACISHGLPQARRVHELFPREQVVVIGLHTVFEHHAVMGPDALAALIHEYRWPFPIGIDMPGSDGDGVPRTMRELALQGTPSALLLDRGGRVRLHHFGATDDMALGAMIGQLLASRHRPQLWPPATWRSRGLAITRSGPTATAEAAWPADQIADGVSSGWREASRAIDSLNSTTQRATEPITPPQSIDEGRSLRVALTDPRAAALALAINCGQHCSGYLWASCLQAFTAASAALKSSVAGVAVVTRPRAPGPAWSGRTLRSVRGSRHRAGARVDEAADVLASPAPTCAAQAA